MPFSFLGHSNSNSNSQSKATNNEKPAIKKNQSKEVIFDKPIQRESRPSDHINDQPTEVLDDSLISKSFMTPQEEAWYRSKDLFEAWQAVSKSIFFLNRRQRSTFLSSETLTKEKEVMEFLCALRDTTYKNAREEFIKSMDQHEAHQAKLKMEMERIQNQPKPQKTVIISTGKPKNESNP